jgi:hypothetical protein
MPQKINMFISNGNPPPALVNPPINTASLGSAPVVVRPPSALNAPIIARIHNVRPGCGSCGRH